MKYRFINVYEIRGLNHSPGKSDIILYTREDAPSVVPAPGMGVTVILTDSPDKYCYDIDRAQCLGYLMLKGRTGQPSSAQLELESHINQVRKNRNKQIGTSEVLVFIAEGEVEADLSGSTTDRGDYILGFDIISKQQIAESLSAEIDAALAGLCLSAKHEILQIKRVAGDVYLLSESGNPVYSLGFSVSGELYSSKHMTDEIIEETQKYLSSLVIDSALSRVYKLFIQSVSRENDVLRRFMFSWSALEILVNKVFSEYEKLFIQNLLGADPADQTQRYFDRIRDVMKGKYRILDKFVVIAACIGKDSAEKDIEDFERIKKTRDTLLHGERIDEKSLPVDETIRLLRKYIRCHIVAKAA